MYLSLFVSLLVAVSAAPHAHNAHQNRLVRRRAGPLLHADMLALYNAVQVSSSTTGAEATATVAVGHGPYAAGEAHGGNVNAVKAIAEVTATATADAATATDVSNSTSDWVTAAASRNTTMYSNSLSNDPSEANDEDDFDDETNDNTEADDSNPETVIEVSSDKKSSTGVPGWAIGLTVVLILGSLAGLAVLLYFKYRKSPQDQDSSEKAGKPSKKEPEDALSSYKAFWELKRRSAGSFISADASPEALASDLHNNLSRPASHSSNVSLPMYEPHESRAPGLAIASPVDTPLNEEAPPRGFLYQ